MADCRAVPETTDVTPALCECGHPREPNHLTPGAECSQSGAPGGCGCVTFKPKEALLQARDRTVHAECENFQIVRYERAGQWWVESKVKLVPAQHIGVFDAAMRALSAESLGGVVHKGLPGGRVFDAKVRMLRARHNMPEPA